MAPARPLPVIARKVTNATSAVMGRSHGRSWVWTSLTERPVMLTTNAARVG